MCSPHRRAIRPALLERALLYRFPARSCRQCGPSFPAMPSHPVISTKLGRVAGRRSWTVTGSKYYFFKGIPYAKPPVGELRFLDPLQAEPWDGVRDCSYERSISPQPIYKVTPQLPGSFTEVINAVQCLPAVFRFIRRMMNQNEDCLYLNVFSSQLPLSKVDSPNCPVIFWIHGGGFLVGDGGEDMNGFDYFLERGAVVVTFNYRLGPLGFLSVGTEAAPGNAGMKDQVQALRWVRDNITAFGGDPNRVTLFGVSAGASSAHMHTMSPLSRGLFHGVIASSGLALYDWAITSDSLKRASEFAEKLGIQTSNPDALAAALRTVPAAKIVEASVKYTIFRTEPCLVTCLQFVPVVEHRREGAFLVEHPEVTLREGRQAPVPLLTGVNSREGIVWFLGLEDVATGINKELKFNADLKETSERPERAMPPDMAKMLTKEERLEAGKSIIKFYCSEKGICEETSAEFIELIGDLSFTLKFLLASRLHSSTGKAPVYLYRLAIDGRLGIVKGILRDYKYSGVGHGDEMSYFLHMRLIPAPPLAESDPEWIVRQELVGTLYNFIKTGNPNPSNDCPLNGGFKWEPTTPTTLDYLEINKICVMKRDNLGPRYQFWDNLYRKYLNKPLLE